MNDFAEIQGGTPLSGAVTVSGAKNASLPLMIASLLSAEPITFTNVPRLEDTGLLLLLLEQLGAQISKSDDEIKIAVPRLLASEANYSLVKSLRASFWVLAPLLARGGAARVALPGGDLIGARPVDLHLAAFTQMGANISVKNGVVFATAPGGLRSARIELRLPSVGATHQILMAASLTPGETEIRGAACEPEVVALAEMINILGGSVEGAGTSRIIIKGREELGGGKVHVIGDRIEAGTFALAAAATGGDVTINGFDTKHLGSFLEILDSLGVGIQLATDSLRVVAKNRLKPIKVSTGPFPKFATDLQAQLIAALCLAEGDSRVEETIFEGRFSHISELNRMGANISIQDHVATIKGMEALSGAEVDGHDIRAAASLVIAGFAASGTTRISEPRHLRRGYDSLDQKFASLGGIMKYHHGHMDELISVGC